MTPSTSDLQDASKHVVYEIGMFNATARLIQGSQSDPAETFALLEAFAIHTRCLITFSSHMGHGRMMFSPATTPQVGTRPCRPIFKD
jgi:hypothetical protein